MVWLWLANVRDITRPYKDTREIQKTINNSSLEALLGGSVRSQASVLGKTWPENHLSRMHSGTIKAQGGKLAKKPNRKLCLGPNHLKFTAPAKLNDLGWGRGGLQGGGSSGVGVGEGEGGGQVLGEHCGGELVEEPLLVAW